MKRKITLVIILLLALLLSGCSGGNGGGFDFVKFLQNPVVMVIGGIIIAFWMFKRSK